MPLVTTILVKNTENNKKTGVKKTEAAANKPTTKLDHIKKN